MSAFDNLGTLAGPAQERDDVDDEVLAMLRQSAEDFLAAHRNATPRRGVRDLPHETDRRAWSEMAELGWLGLGLPEELGGSGMGLQGAAELSVLFGRTAFPAPYIAACVMPTAILSAAAGGHASRELASDMIGGRRLLTVAWQERVGELVSAQPATRLTDGKVHGRKLFVPAVERDGVLLVHVGAAGRDALVAVAAGDPHVRWERQVSGMGTFSTVQFDDAPVLHGGPLLAGDGASLALSTALDGARIALSAQLTGLAQGALDRTIRHLNDRIQFGRQLGSFQVMQHRCVDLYVGVQLAEASWRHALRTFLQAREVPETAAAISAAKARSSDVALQVTRAAVQMHGAMGFTDEAEPGLYLRSAMHGSAWLGNAILHRRRFQEVQMREVLHA